MPARNKPPVKIGFFSMLTATALLAGCAVGPDYLRPDSTLPDQYSQATAEERSAAPVNPDWWLLFGDTSLNALVEQALVANQDLQAAIARLEAAEAVATHGTLTVTAVEPTSATSGTVLVQGRDRPLRITVELAPLADAPVQFYSVDGQSHAG